jgi:hypothetical protein
MGRVSQVSLGSDFHPDFIVAEAACFQTSDDLLKLLAKLSLFTPDGDELSLLTEHR